jgi:ankyrin repeat protein
VQDSFLNTPYVYAVALANDIPANPVYKRILERLSRVPGIDTSLPRFPQYNEEYPRNFYPDKWMKELRPDFTNHGAIYHKLRDSTAEEFRAFIQANPQSLNDIVTNTHTDELWPPEYFRFPNALNHIESMAETVLMRACRNKDIEKISILLEHPSIDVKQTGSILVYMYFHEYFFTLPNVSFPLMFSWFNLQITEMLLAHPSIDVNQRNVHRETALMRASEMGKAEVVNALLKSPSINLNLRDKNDTTALSLAAKEGHAEVVQALLNDERLDSTLIKQAASCAVGNKVIETICLHKKSSKNQCIKNILLKRAYMAGSLESVQWLISQRAHISVNEYTVKKKHKEQERFIVVALNNAAKEGHLSIMQHLLEEPYVSKYKLTDCNIMGAPDYIEENEGLRAEYEAAGLELIPDKKSLFGMAIQNGRIDIVSYLAPQNLQQYINVAWMNSVFDKHCKFLHPLVNINYRGAAGKTLLMKACESSCDPIYVQLLLHFNKNGVQNDVLIKDDKGRTALQMSYGEKEKLIKEFIEADKIRQQKQLRTLTEVCLFAKIPLNSDVRGIIGSFLIRYRTPVCPKKIVKKINPLQELSAEAVAEIEAEIEEAERRREMEDIDRELEDDSIWAERAEAEAVAEIDAEVLDAEEEEEKEINTELELICIRRHKYWLDSNSKIYTYIAEDEVGDEIGSMINGKPSFHLTEHEFAANM